MADSLKNKRAKRKPSRGTADDQGYAIRAFKLANLLRAYALRLDAGTGGDRDTIHKSIDSAWAALQGTGRTRDSAARVALANALDFALEEAMQVGGEPDPVNVAGMFCETFPEYGARLDVAFVAPALSEWGRWGGARGSNKAPHKSDVVLALFESVGLPTTRACLEKECRIARKHHSLLLGVNKIQTPREMSRVAKRST